MSVAFADYDGDGFPDAFVTNDNMPNFLFHNKGNGTFEEVALLAGAALRDHGKAVASMGVEFKDYDNDGQPDLMITALAGETYPVFRNLGVIGAATEGSGRNVKPDRGKSHAGFTDATYSSKIGAGSVKHSGWGLGLFDFNNDGWKDLFTANSHVNDRVAETEAGVYREPNSVFENTRDGKFRDASESLTGHAKAHRGAAFGDFDGDGRIDAVTSALGEPAELWRNVTEPAGHWLIVKLRGTKSNRDGIGAQIRIGKQYAEMTTTTGYASSSAWGVHFGLGEMALVPAIQIRWPSGIVQMLTNVKADQVLSVVEK